MYVLVGAIIGESIVQNKGSCGHRAAPFAQIKIVPRFGIQRRQLEVKRCHLKVIAL